MSEAAIEWVDVGPIFGSAMPHGSCAAATGGDDRVACGYPRRADGTCLAGHPAQHRPIWDRNGSDGTTAVGCSCGASTCDVAGFREHIAASAPRDPQ